MKQLLVLKVGELPERIPAHEDTVWDRCHSIIAGYIVPLFVTVPMAYDNGDRPRVRRQAWINEDGLPLGLPGNVAASQLAGQPVVGTVVVVLNQDDQPDLDTLLLRGRGQTLQE